MFSALGETIFDAVRKTTRTSPRKLFWSHTKVLVIGEEVARKGIQPALEFFGRDAEERRNFLLAITRERAENIIKADVKTDKIPALALLDQLELYRATSTAAPISLNDFLRGYKSKTAQLFPIVQVVKDQGGKEGYDVSGAAAFKGDRLVANFTPIETRGALWVLGKVKSAIIVTKCPNTKGRTPKDKIAFEVFKAKSSVKVRQEQDRFAIDVKIEERGNLAEATCTEDEVKPDSITQLENLKREKIEAEIQEALDKAKEIKADIFGFGEAIHRKYPKEWKKLAEKWDEQFQTL